MFTADALIDTVQTGKKNFVNTFVTNEAAKEALINFVDAQTEYTKKATKAGVDTFTSLANEVVKSAQTASKYDYVKAAETFTKAAETFTKSFTTASKK